jgi:hypothetical protein
LASASAGSANTAWAAIKAYAVTASTSISCESTKGVAAYSYASISTESGN